VGLVEIYKQKVIEHNNKLLSNPFMDSGFDLFVPELTVFNVPFTSQFIDFSVKAEMVYCDVQKDTIENTAFTVHPRSSLSKTPLMLANHTGIIDSGYRGSLIGAFRWLTKDALQYAVEKHTRLVQICHPSLCPIYVVLVDENQLSNTIRGDGGFGSTGV
jgi:dUTP pyrophosphatase